MMLPIYLFFYNLQQQQIIVINDSYRRNVHFLKFPYLATNRHFLKASIGSLAR